jgi:predicted RNase H-like HicB family nuclease
MTLKRYGVVFEGDATGYSAYVPDLPGCIGAGETLEETREDIQSAMAAHVHFLLREGDPVPEPREIIPVEIPNASVAFIEVDVPSTHAAQRA